MKKLSLIGMLLLTSCGTHPMLLPSQAMFSPQVQAMQAHRDDDDHLDIRLYRTYGHENEVKLEARVVEFENAPPTDQDSRWKTLLRNLLGFSVDEKANVRVLFKLNGKTVEAVSDQEGMIRLKSNALGHIPPGRHILSAEIAPGQKYYGSPSQMPLVIHSRAENSLGIISDIDDTIKDSRVTDKWEAAKKLLFQSPYEAKPVPGTPSLYRVLDQAIDRQADGDIFYVSGSPINLSRQVYTFLDHQQFPQGSVTLKKWGFGADSDNPMAQNNYKLRNIREIFQTYPQKSFLLFGDSGEKDPEIYQQVAKEFPGRVKAIFINNVTQSSPQDPRFQGMYLTPNTQAAAQILHQLGYLSATDLSLIQSGI